MARIPVGTHVVKVVSTAIGRTSTGKEQIAVTFEDGEGNRSTWYGYFTDRALERTMETLTDVLGWDAAADDHRIDALHNSDTLVGREAEVVVEEEEYQGRFTEKIKWVNAVGGGAALKEQMSPEEASGFAANLRKKLLSKGGGASKPKPAAKPRAKATAPPADDYETPSDDDIPF